MIRTLHLENFTVFTDEELEIGKKLNVIVGENGTGKTHVLKLIYSIYVACDMAGREADLSQPDNKIFGEFISRKIKGVFRPDQIGNLVQNGKKPWQLSKVFCSFDTKRGETCLKFEIASESRMEITVHDIPDVAISHPSVFIPTRELVTIAPGFVALYETMHLPFEETWRDTCIHLQRPLARLEQNEKTQELLKPLEAAMGGHIEADEAGRFYLVTGKKRREMHLVAEGLRKLAMLARIIATGMLANGGALFWDEPEANLNPRITKVLAKTILDLSQRGIQIFIATHSLFLMRELDILLQNKNYDQVKAETQFFGLNFSGKKLNLLQGSSVDDIGEIAALDEELEQSDRFMAAGSSK